MKTTERTMNKTRWLTGWLIVIASVALVWLYWNWLGQLMTEIEMEDENYSNFIEQRIRDGAEWSLPSEKLP